MVVVVLQTIPRPEKVKVVVREVSSTKEITFYRSTKWTKDRPTPPILASSKRKNKKK